MSDPIQPELHAAMNAIAHSLDGMFNGPALPGIPRKPEVGFVLLAFKFGQVEGGRVNYISNGEGPDMIAAMHELLGRLEGRLVDVPETRQ